MTASRIPRCPNRGEALVLQIHPTAPPAAQAPHRSAVPLRLHLRELLLTQDADSAMTPLTARSTFRWSEPGTDVPENRKDLGS